MTLTDTHTLTHIPNEQNLRDEIMIIDNSFYVLFRKSYFSFVAFAGSSPKLISQKYIKSHFTLM